MCFTGDTMVINTIEKLKSFLKQERERNKKIGLVPTMGFLHAGHLSLIERAKKEWELIVETLSSDYGFTEEDNDITWAKDELAQLEKLLGEK